MRLRPRSCSQRRWRSSSSAPGWTPVTTPARGPPPSRPSRASRSRPRRRPSGTRRPCRPRHSGSFRPATRSASSRPRPVSPWRRSRVSIPNVSIDLALHRREDPAAVKRALLLAAARRRAVAVRGASRPAGGRRQRLHRSGRPHRRGARRVAVARAAADRVDHEADDGARDARAPQAHGRRRRSTRAPPPSASRPIGLRGGERLTIRDLIKAALIQSANDAADALALSVAPDFTAFAAMMNAKAAALGLHDTHFVRPDGLDAPGHVSSAADVTKLARVVMRTRFIRETVRRGDRRRSPAAGRCTRGTTCSRSSRRRSASRPVTRASRGGARSLRRAAAASRSTRRSSAARRAPTGTATSSRC